MNDDTDIMGPVDYLVIEYPDGRMTGDAIPPLIDLVDRGIVNILDLAFVAKDPDGSMREIALTDLNTDVRQHFSVFDGARSGLLSTDELEDAASVIAPGSTAGILIYENVWAGPFAAALRRSGAQLIADGRIPVQALLAAVS